MYGLPLAHLELRRSRRCLDVVEVDAGSRDRHRGLGEPLNSAILKNASSEWGIE